MKNKINWKFTVCIIYIVVFIVLKIMHKPNFDFFTDSNTLPPSMLGAIEKKRNEINTQMEQQYTQDKEIAKIKRTVDSLRNDLKIIKSKEQDELSTIYQQINGSDSVAEAMGVEGGSEMKRIMSSDGFNKGDGKNYNLNFNLDDE